MVQGRLSIQARGFRQAHLFGGPASPCPSTAPAWVHLFQGSPETAHCKFNLVCAPWRINRVIILQKGKDPFQIGHTLLSQGLILLG